MTIARTLFIADVVGRIVDGLKQLGIKQDVTGDPAASSPGQAFRLYVETLEPMHDAQGDGEQESFQASMALVVGAQTSGGNRVQTALDLATVAEKVANMVKDMHTLYGDMDLSWSGARVFVADGDVTKLAMTLTCDY